MNLLRCPNPECGNDDVHSDDVRELSGAGEVFVCCDDCNLRGPSVSFVPGQLEEAEPEATRLWNALSRSDMRLVERVNELVQSEEALNEECVRLQCIIDDLREEPWIPVTERLPGKGGSVDIAFPGGVRGRVAWDTEWKFFYEPNGPESWPITEVTHWRPYREPRRP